MSFASPTTFLSVSAATSANQAPPSRVLLADALEVMRSMREAAVELASSPSSASQQAKTYHDDSQDTSTLDLGENMLGESIHARCRTSKLEACSGFCAKAKPLLPNPREGIAQVNSESCVDIQRVTYKTAREREQSPPPSFKVIHDEIEGVQAATTTGAHAPQAGCNKKAMQLVTKAHEGVLDCFDARVEDAFKMRVVSAMMVDGSVPLNKIVVNESDTMALHVYLNVDDSLLDAELARPEFPFIVLRNRTLREMHWRPTGLHEWIQANPESPTLNRLKTVLGAEWCLFECPSPRARPAESQWRADLGVHLSSAKTEDDTSFLADVDDLREFALMCADTLAGVENVDRLKEKWKAVVSRFANEAAMEPEAATITVRFCDSLRLQTVFGQKSKLLRTIKLPSVISSLLELFGLTGSPFADAGVPSTCVLPFPLSKSALHAKSKMIVRQLQLKSLGETTDPRVGGGILNYYPLLCGAKGETDEFAKKLGPQLRSLNCNLSFDLHVIATNKDVVAFFVVAKLWMLIPAELTERFVCTDDVLDVAGLHREIGEKNFMCRLVVFLHRVLHGEPFTLREYWTAMQESIGPELMANAILFRCAFLDDASPATITALVAKKCAEFSNILLRLRDPTIDSWRWITRTPCQDVPLRFPGRCLSRGKASPWKAKRMRAAQPLPDYCGDV